MRQIGAWCLLAVLALPAAAFGQVTVTPQNPGALFKTGEKVEWTVTAANAATPGQYTYNLLRNGAASIRQGTLEFTEGKASIAVTLDEPGAVFLDIRPAPGATQPAGGGGGGAGGRGRGRGGNAGRVMDGAPVAPDKLKPALLRPDDFDAWWGGKIEMLGAVPVNARVEKAESGRAGVDYAKVTLDNINGTRIQAQLARPAGEGKHPALLILQWAGVYALDKTWVTNRAAQGWLALNVEPHDMPIDDTAAIAALGRGALANYPAIGNDDREKSYFLRMYLGDYRAAEYLAAQPDWDGKTLVVMGTSMGGQQSFVTAGLNGKVTGMICLVPSGCDVGAQGAGRAMAYPNWPNQPKVIETVRYFDPVNFASRIKAPALVAMGLYDETSPPVGVYPAVNQLLGAKEVMLLHSGHQDVAGSQRPYNLRAEEWLAAIVKGQAPPARP